MNRPTDFDELLLALGFCAGNLTRPEMFTAVAEALQGGTLRADYVVFLRDTLTRVLQLAGAEPLPGPTLFVCPKCGASSSNPTDLAEGYCNRCHEWTGKR